MNVYSQFSSLIGASTGGNGVSSEEYDRVSIRKDHAFSILAATALSEGSDRFVLVRDPHSYSNYREKSLTNVYLKQLQLVNPARRSTGAFWISWRRFLRYFSSITISNYNSDYYDIRKQYEFTQSSTENIMAYYIRVPK